MIFECKRSHPHENMDSICELRTQIARLANENARLKAKKDEKKDFDVWYRKNTLNLERHPIGCQRYIFQFDAWKARAK